MSKIEGLNPGATLGEVEKPPFAVLPDPGSLFLQRSKRLEVLAADHPLQPYLRFLAVLSRAQHDIYPHLPTAALPSSGSIALALQHGMRPLSRGVYEADDLIDETIARMVVRLPDADVSAQAAAAVEVGSMTSAIVGWPKAHNTRFCTCSLCPTMWNVLRVKCVPCGSTDGISYRAIDDKPDTIKAETCEKCRGYVKVLCQVDDPALEPLPMLSPRSPRHAARSGPGSAAATPLS